MAYLRTGLGSLSDEQTRALLDISPEELRKLNLDRRVELALQHAELETAKREAFWNAVQAFAAGALPILAFFGIQRAARR
jgi:hypothetical protein